MNEQTTTSSTTQLMGSTNNYLIVQKLPPRPSTMQSYSGTLTFEKGCAELVSDVGRHVIIWPQNTKSVTTGGVLTVSTGSKFFRTGSAISIDGYILPAGEAVGWYPPNTPTNCISGVVVASSVE